ncbi:leukocyte surface antigen CD53-like [Battus philenor]|uniref:leukocyte surface antigen CD53-like n=1 Tax=Battus philenor TaxID=42288 RepID=UPI0035D0FDF2
MNIPKVLKSVRYTLAGVNSLYMITGLLLLIIGILAIVEYTYYEDLITKRFFTLPGFVIATGVIILLTSVLGFYGALSENFYVIAAYVALLLTTLVFEISMTIVAFGLEKDAVTEIRSPMIRSLQLYESRIDIAKLWDDLQMEFKCCGVAGRNDWVSNRIPVSCCHIDYGTISPFVCTTANAYTAGCAGALGEWLSYYAYVIGVIAATVTCLQVLLTALSGWLAWRSKYEEVELES